MFYVESVVWSVISGMISGTGFVVSGVGRVLEICVAGRLFVLMLAVGAVIRLA